MESEKNSIKQSLLWNTFGNIIYLFCQWLLTIIIVRLTSYREAGIYSLAVSITNILYSISLYGIRNYQVSDIKNKYNDREYVINRYLTCFISFIICIGVIILNSYGKQQSEVIVLYMVFRIQEAYVDVLQGIEQKKYRMDMIGKSCIIRGVLNLSIFLVVIVVTKNLSFSIMGMILMTAMIIKFYDEKNVKCLIGNKMVWSYYNVLNLLKEGIVLVSYTVLVAATPVIPRYFLELMLGEEMLGIYSTIATPAVIVQAAIVYLMTPIIGPLTEKCIQKDRKGYMSYIVKMLLAILAIFIFCILGSSIFGKIGLKLLFGDTILPYFDLLLPVICCTFVTAIALFINALLTIFRRFKYIMLINIVGTVVSCFVSSSLIAQFGINGTSYAHIIAMGVQILVGVLFTIISFKKEFLIINEERI